MRRQLSSKYRQNPTLFQFLLLGIFLLALPASAPADVVPMGVSVNAPADWTSGSHSTFRVNTTNGPRTMVQNILPTISDLAVSSYEDYFFRIERFGSDNVAKFHFSEPGSVIWQVPTKEDDEAGLQSDSSNPYALVFASHEKAYLIRYGANTAWIVDPSVDYANRNQFKTGELDLSAYADEDGYSEMCGGIVVNGKLFVVMQRLYYWCPEEGVFSYVAVFDTTTNEEIDTGMGAGDGLKGIPLPVYNAGYPESGAIQYLAETGKIYIAGPASMGFCTSGVGGKGGVAALDPDTYQVDLVLDGVSDPDNFSHGNIFGVAMASADKGYFVGNPDAYGSGSANLFRAFNPQTGEVDDTPVRTDLDGKDIGGLKIGPDGKLWICDSTEGRIVILDPDDNSIEKIDPGLPAKALAFGEVENQNPNRPVLVTPADEAQGVALAAVFQIGAFDDPDGDSQGSTLYQVSRDLGFSDLVYDRQSTSKLTKLTLPAGILSTDDDGETYFWRARVTDNQGGASVFSEINQFTVITRADSDDTDGNGVPDDQAVTDANNLILTGNPNLAANEIVTVQTDSGEQMAVATTGTNITTVNSVRAVNPDEIDDDNGKPGNMATGLVSFQVEVDNPGDTAEVTIYFSEAAATDSKWYRYDAADGWEDYEEHVTWAADRKSLVAEFKDGGFGDDDGLENGIITDPSGPGGAAAAASGGGGGGGCFIGQVAGTGPNRSNLIATALGLLAGLLLIVLATRRNSRQH